MKCEICHKSDAKKAIRVQVGGKERELYVCRDCAEKHTEHLPRRTFDHRPFDDIFDDSDDFGDLHDGFVNGLDSPFPADGEDEDGGHRHATLAEDIPPCPKCGATVDDVSHSRLLGCPYCYVAFKEYLLREYGLHGSFGGKMPKRSGNARSGDGK